MKQVIIYGALIVLCIFSYGMFIYINSSSNDAVSIDDYKVNFRETLDFKGSWFVSNEFRFTDDNLERHDRTLIGTNTTKIPWESVTDVVLHDPVVHGRAEIYYVNAAKERRAAVYYFSTKDMMDKVYYYFDLYNIGYKLTRKTY